MNYACNLHELPMLKNSFPSQSENFASYSHKISCYVHDSNNIFWYSRSHDFPISKIIKYYWKENNALFSSTVHMTVTLKNK